MTSQWQRKNTLTAPAIEQYLQRLHYSGDYRLDIHTLTMLHQAHMENVPFENLDIALGRSIDLSLKSLFDKIVVNKRGGFCYELNSLFAALLSSLGFKVKLLAARVYGDSGYGQPFDHLLLAVELGQQCFIADVGFGDSFIQPLLLQQRSDPQNPDQSAKLVVKEINEGKVIQLASHYKIIQDAENFVLKRQQHNKQWQPQYLFSLHPYQISAFNEMCLYHQTCEKSSFTQKSVCSVATTEGRKTLSNDRFIETLNAERTEQEINSPEQYLNILEKHFQVILPPNISDNQWQKLFNKDGAR